MNIPLLRKVKATILAEPKRLCMSVWLVECLATEGGLACKTVGCIAGWACCLSADGRSIAQRRQNAQRTLDWHSSGRDALGLTDAQADCLFHVTFWPEEHAHAYYSGATPMARAKATARRIDAFIRSKGRQ